MHMGYTCIWGIHAYGVHMHMEYTCTWVYMHMGYTYSGMRCRSARFVRGGVRGGVWGAWRGDWSGLGWGVRGMDGVMVLDSGDAWGGW